MDGAVANAFWSISRDSSNLKLPWETGPQAEVFRKRKRVSDDQIFFRVQCPSNHAPSLMEDDDVELNVPSTFNLLDDMKPLYSTCVKALAVKTFEEDRSAKSRLAIRKWRLILSNNYGATKIGRDIHDEILIGSDDGYIDELLTDVFGVKSPNTLLKRASSIIKYLYWHAEQYEDSGFPLTERAVYEYFRYLEASNSGATASTSFREAVRFCKHIMGLDSADVVLESRKISGAAQRHFSQKRLLSQAPVLTVSDVKELERICVQGSCKMDRYISGAFLICVYGRCRWRDVANLHSCDLSDKLYVEIATVVHKTSVTAVRKTTLLPIAAPTIGISDYGWFESWTEVSNELGIDFASVPFGPLMKAPRDGTSFLDRPLTSTEASLWLTGLLAKTDGRKFTSHGLKSTALSWCAKAGLSKEVREILGRHSSGVQSTSAVYSRDLQAGPLRRLVTLLKKIRLQIFDPDAGRGGRWLADRNGDADSKCGYDPSNVSGDTLSCHATDLDEMDLRTPSLRSWEAPPFPEIEQHDNVESFLDRMKESAMNIGDNSDVSDDDLSSADESSEDDGATDLEEVARLFSGPEIRPQDFPEELKCFINKRNKVVHRVSQSSFGRFVCGVKVTENYEAVKGAMFFRFPTCGKCMKDVHIEG